MTRATQSGARLSEVRHFEGVVTWIGLLPSGDAIVRHYAADASGKIITCLTPAGVPRWTRRLIDPSWPRWSSWPVVTANGETWIGYPDRLVTLDHDGREVASILLGLSPGEQLGAFALLETGVIVAIGCPEMRPEAHASPRVIRLDRGAVRWSTSLTPGLLQQSWVWQLSVTGARPRGWEPSYFSPLVIVGEDLLATYYEIESGLGCGYCVDVSSGALRWATETGPSGEVAVDGAGNFLVGRQGYGVRETRSYSRNGRVLDSWPTHGPSVVDADGRVRVAEMDNSTAAGRFLRLEPDGDLRVGPSVRGYYCAYPVLDDQGLAYVVRGGHLLAVNAQLKVTTLYKVHEIPAREPCQVLTRMLLAGTSRLVVGVNNAVLTFDGPFGNLAATNWPCGGGTLGGNPVIQA
jgi:outer membrane protein assembly factor BamB